MRAGTILLFACVSWIVVAVSAEEQPQATSELQSIAIRTANTDAMVAVYAPGPKWIPGKSFREQPLREHGNYMLKLFKEGRLRDGGPFLDSEGGLTVFIAKDEAEAKALLAADPAIREGVFTANLHPWYAVEWGG